MGNQLELFSDIAIVADVIFTAIAVMFGSFGNKDLTNIFFGISGASLTCVFICIVYKVDQKNK